jgi:hypothetical protein
MHISSNQALTQTAAATQIYQIALSDTANLYLEPSTTLILQEKTREKMCHISIVTTRFRIPPCNTQSCGTSLETVIQCEFRKKIYMGVRYVKGRCMVHRDAVRDGARGRSTIENGFGRRMGGERVSFRYSSRCSSSRLGRVLSLHSRYGLHHDCRCTFKVS